MNKNAIKNYAIWARNELITRVTQKAFEYGVSKDNIVDFNADSINGKLLNSEEKQQRQKLISEVKEKGFDQVMEEVSYTWFNRFIALRYMEVNNYLPNRVRVFTNENNEFKPQILEEAANVELDGLDKEKVYELIEKNKNEELYKLLLLATCNEMHNYLPGMFATIKDYKVLLFPENLLRNESVLGKLISEINEDSWLDQVQIIGWLYQYYISEKHDQVVDPLYGKTISKEDIPAATELFTPDWIVKYMVDNSLGTYWISSNSNSLLKPTLLYNNSSLSEPSKQLDITKIKFFDPCMGSGHILVYAFDVFMKIYRECGYSDRDSATSILRNNLFGLDIDERAYQLAYFAIMMKARSYNRKLFQLRIEPNIYVVEESELFENFNQEYIYKIYKEDDLIVRNYLISTYKHGKEIGSILRVKQEYDYIHFLERLEEIKNTSLISIEYYDWLEHEYPLMKKISTVANIMSQKFELVVTNPPYLNNQPEHLKKYILDNYNDYSNDLFSTFVARNLEYCTLNGLSAYMTPNVWMYIQSFEKMRENIINTKSITSFLLLAKGSYKEAMVDICSFVLSNKQGLMGNYVRLEDYKADMDVQESMFLNHKNLIQGKDVFIKNNQQFLSIPGHPIAFWLSDDFLKTFDNDLLNSKCTSKAGIVTGKDKLFFRCWFEVDFKEITLNANDFKDRYAYKYVPINKGGNYRRWYGNYEYVINIYDLWNSDKVKKSVRRSDPDYYFKKAITWSYVTSGISSFRISENKLFSTAAPSIYFDNDDELYYALGLLNNIFAQKYFDAFNSTVNLNVTNVTTIPFKKGENYNDIVSKVKDNILLSKYDWDSRELSFDFKKDPLVSFGKGKISVAINKYLLEKENLMNQLSLNERYINKYFISLYGLENEIKKDLIEKDISISIPSKKEVIKNFINYSVGCMFGRYSLNEDGLYYAGGTFDLDNYTVYTPDKDNIIPICDDEYFNDDIVGRFIEFVKVVYSEETLEENLEYIADVLGGKGTPREVIRNYFLNDFFKDHCNTYQVTGAGKRPIYWLFDSGKKNGFKALIYIHRYTPDLIARMRTQYIHEQQARYRNQIEMLEKQVDSDISTSERVRLNKQLKKFKEQDEELRKYEEKIHHWADRMEPMDLDEGVKANYEKFQELLAKIK